MSKVGRCSRLPLKLCLGSAGAAIRPLFCRAGLACDPVTGEVISCKPGAVRLPTRTWRGRTAKELSVAILETDHGFQPCTHLEHANYLGRELQRAEFALLTGQRYTQD
jgi:hypothetical protein